MIPDPSWAQCTIGHNTPNILCAIRKWTKMELNKVVVKWFVSFLELEEFECKLQD